MRYSVLPRLMIMITIAAIAFLAACGGSATAPTQVPIPSPTTATTATAIPVPTSVPTTRSALTVAGSVTVPGGSLDRNCGTIQMRGPETIDAAAAQQAVDCFWQSFQQRCPHPPPGTVVLRVTQMGVDTFTTRDFVIRGSGGACIIEEKVEFRAVPRPPTTAAYTCADLTHDPNGALHFQACGKDGDITVGPP